MAIISPSGNQEIDGLLWGWGWGGWTLSYSFPTTSATYIASGYDSVSGFQALTAGQQAAMTQILSNFDSVSGLEFFVDTGDTDLRFGQATSLDYGGIHDGDHAPGDTGTAEGNAPDPSRNNPYQYGDSWFTVGVYSGSPIAGSFTFAAGLMHELGHCLGLKHGHTTLISNGTVYPVLPADHDSQEYTIMTYRGYPGAPPNEGTLQYPQTLMQNDIAALQYMYGADYSTNSGDTVYTWSSSNGELFVDGAAQNLATGDHILMTIWDGGGIDTYAFSNYVTNLVVNLAPGEWTTTSATQLANLGPDPGNPRPARGNIANALLYQDSLASIIENAIGGSGADTFYGNLVGNVLRGGGGGDILVGLGGADALYGEQGDDNLKGGDIADILDGGPGIDTVLYDDSTVGVTVTLGDPGVGLGYGTGLNGTAGSDKLFDIENVSGSFHHDVIYGNAAANNFYGYDGNDYLDGRGGADSFYGGEGFDLVSYMESEAAVNASLTSGTGNGGQAQGDRFYDIEGIVGSRSADLLVGNAGANDLNGYEGADRLKGGGGADALLGDAGSDVLKGGGGADVLSGGEGSDTASFADSDANVGIILQTGVVSGGTAQGDTLIGIENLEGSSFNDLLAGDANPNTLNGLSGIDALQGLGGDDFLYVDNPGDIVVENNGEGTDRVFASVSYTLGGGPGGFIERLSTTNNAGTDPINLTGNNIINAIYGNAGANILDGKGGADTLAGFGGNDFYFVDNAGDLVYEGAGEGASDRIFAAASYTLGAGVQVEMLTTTDNAGTSGINLAGNALVNIIFGNAGANTLDGKGGADTMAGLGGNDFYFVDNAADVVAEGAGQGTGDRVFASVSYTLGAGVQVEMFTTTNNAGTAALNLTGNEFANTIYGNAGSNALKGGLGNDVLVGLGGADAFVFNTALGTGNVDHIADFSGGDAIWLHSGIFTALAPGALPAGAYRSGTAAADADDRIVYNPNTGELSYDADGLGGTAGVHFAVLDNLPNLASTQLFIA